MLIVNPAIPSSTKDPISEMGSEIAVINVDLTEPKKKNTVIIVKIIPIEIVS